jgi:hypothetical protein
MVMGVCGVSDMHNLVSLPQGLARSSIHSLFDLARYPCTSFSGFTSLVT